MLGDHTGGEGLVRRDGRERVRSFGKAPHSSVNGNNHSGFHEKILEWKQVQIDQPQIVLIITLFGS